MVTSAPSWVKALTMRTPTAGAFGRDALKRWMAFRASRPSMPGMFTSSVTRSGGVAWINSRALAAFQTEPTTSTSSWPARASSSTLRKMRESSTIRTFDWFGILAFDLELADDPPQFPHDVRELRGGGIDLLGGGRV